MNRWKVRKRNGRWHIYDNYVCHAIYDTLPEAHTEATCNAIAAELYAPGGLKKMLHLLKVAGL